MEQTIADTLADLPTAEPTVSGQGSTQIPYSKARELWEDGCLSEWIEEQGGGFPLCIDGVEIPASDIENSLSDDRWDA